MKLRNVIWHFLKMHKDLSVQGEEGMDGQCLAGFGTDMLQRWNAGCENGLPGIPWNMEAGFGS